MNRIDLYRYEINDFIYYINEIYENVFMCYSYSLSTCKREILSNRGDFHTCFFALCNKISERVHTN